MLRFATFLSTNLTPAFPQTCLNCNPYMSEPPHITVACVIEQKNRFLLVREKSEGRIVYNQPAGHLEPGESLEEAALRETLEETGWDIQVSHFLGIYHYTAPSNGVSYVRHCFIAKPLMQRENFVLDPDIIDTCWLRLDELEQQKTNCRSPLVIKVIRDYLNGNRYPLSIVNHNSASGLPTGKKE